MEIDEETQALIDQETGVDEEPTQDKRELALLQVLERIDRDLARVEEEKSDTMKEFNDEIKDLKKRRENILSSISDHRAGVRDLPFDA